jgi:hypothetical protein
MAITIPIISEFDGAGIQRAVAEFKQLEGAGKKAQFAIKKAAVPAGLALAGLAVALGDAAKGAAEDAAAQVVLAGNLRNSAHATDAQIKSTEAMITKMSMATGVADDELRPAFSKLVLATNDVERSNKLLAIAQDVAARTGKPLETVTQALAKAEMGQYAALKKLGIPMSEGIQASIDLQKEQKKLAKDEAALALVRYQIAEGMLSGAEATKALTKANEKFSSQSKIVNDLMATTGDYADDVANKFKGGAADAANTAQGQFKRLGVALAETKESIGAALLPAIEAVLPFLQAMGQWASQNSTVFLVIAGVIGGIAAAIVITNAAMTAWGAATKAFTVIQGIFNAVMAANPIVLFALAIAALVVGLVIAYKKFDAFRDIVDAVFSAIKTGIKGGMDAITTYLSFVMGVYKAIFNGIATLWNNTIGKLKFSVPNWVPGLGGKGFEVPNIPMLAAGGIVSSPTLALIGERGPEAVVPLTGPNAGGGMGGNTVNINVNGGDPNAVVQALRTYMRQNGSVPIKISNAF